MTALISPQNWKDASAEQKADYVGCGPGKFGDWLVPDTMWGLCVGRACSIHDWMYAYGKTEEDRLEADDTLLANLYILIDNDDPSWVFRSLRRVRARTYYFFVRQFGANSFNQRGV